MTSFLERFLRKTIPSDITYEDFLNFRKQHIEEHQYLDYKSGEILVTRGNVLVKMGNSLLTKGF